MAALGDEDVGGLDVAVDDAFGVRRIEGVGNLNGEREQRVVLQRTSRHHVLQGQAIQKLHGDKALALVFANFVNGADVGMVERGGSTGLTAKALQRLRVLGHIVRQEFERDKTPKRGVLGLVHHAHSATAQLFYDAVVRDGLADHALTNNRVGPMLGGNAAAVNEGKGGCGVHVRSGRAMQRRPPLRQAVRRRRTSGDARAYLNLSCPWPRPRTAAHPRC